VQPIFPRTKELIKIKIILMINL